MRKYAIILCVFLLVLMSSGCIQESQTPVACTLDAKVCPDGSYVGRVGPDCEFEKCPETADGPSTESLPPTHFPKEPLSPDVKGVCEDGETRDDVCPDGVTSYLAENCVGGEWHTVMYVMNPCESVSGSGSDDSVIDSFEDCIKAGFPAMESYPRQCRADGKTFVEKI